MNPPAVPHPGALVNRNKKAFIGLPAPIGYVAGVGRGATGFTTRSDIGPARESSDVPDDRHLPPKKVAKKDEEEEEDLNDNNYDEFAGYGGSLFNKDVYDDQDEEADKIYASLSAHIAERGKTKRRIEKEKIELENYRRERPKIQELFRDLKPGLAHITEQEWASIPEVGDSRNRKQRNQRHDKQTPVPDSVLAMKTGIASGKQVTSIDPVTGLRTPMMPDDQVSSQFLTPGSLDLRRIGEARNTLMGIRLNQVSDSVGGQTVVDPKGYLTGLQSMTPSCSTDVTAINHARKLLKSVRETNPDRATAWMASAEFEKEAGNLRTARQLIMDGCRRCPDTVDLWLQAVALHPMDEAKGIMVRAIRHLPSSVKLWLKAADLETEDEAKRKVFQKAREAVPNSEIIWKRSVELEKPENARILLSQAVREECCPTSVDLWLSLAKLEPYEDAQETLIKARTRNPTDRQIWIAGAKLVEANGDLHKVDKMIKRSIKKLKMQGVEINRDLWLKEAVEAERTGAKLTCYSIIENVIFEEDDRVGTEERLITYLDNAEKFTEIKAYECARAVYEQIVKFSPGSEIAWLPYADFERQHGNMTNLEVVLRKAVENCPRSEASWLMAAKLKWRQGDVNESRRLLCQAFEANPNSERILLAAVKLDTENDEYDNARKLLAKACRESRTARVLMKSAKFEWCLGNLAEAKNLLHEGIKKYPDFHKLYLMLGQISEQENQPHQAIRHYESGLKYNPTSVPLWISLSRLKEKLGSVIEARSTLEKARIRNKGSAELWFEAIRLERRAKNDDGASMKLAKGLQECRGIQDCPNVGLLWAEQIYMATKSQRKSKMTDAVKNCESVHVLVAVSWHFWAVGKINKAREYFHRAIKENSDYGDAWGYLYKFEKSHGTEEQQEEIRVRCASVEPRHGMIWTRVSKDVLNWRLKTPAILELVSEMLEQPFR